eukprot:6178813-Pleurochrysis_carterae.AAC.2
MLALCRKQETSQVRVEQAHVQLKDVQLVPEDEQVPHTEIRLKGGLCERPAVSKAHEAPCS